MEKSTYVYQVGPRLENGYTIRPVKIKDDTVSGELTLVTGDVVDIGAMNKYGGEFFTTMGRAKHFLKSKD